MAELGIIAPDERLELLEGELFYMTPIGVPHAQVAANLLSLLLFADTATTRLWVAQPINLLPDSEPQPDLCIIKRAKRATHPLAADVLLLVEVSDSSLPKDKKKKLDLYAKHAIPEYWIIDIAALKLWAYRKPAGGVYQDIGELGMRDVIAPASFPRNQIAISDLFA